MDKCYPIKHTNFKVSQSYMHSKIILVEGKSESVQPKIFVKVQKLKLTDTWEASFFGVTHHAL